MADKTDDLYDALPQVYWDNYLREEMYPNLYFHQLGTHRTLNNTSATVRWVSPVAISGVAPLWPFTAEPAKPRVVTLECGYCGNTERALWEQEFKHNCRCCGASQWKLK